MHLTASMLLVTAVAVFVLIRYAGLKVWHAVVVLLFGFFLAGSDFAPYIRQFLTEFLGVK